MSITSNSTLDITNNRIILDGGANSSTEAWLIKCLAAGCNGGLWNGTGIDSSFAAASSGVYGVGLADANDPRVTGLASGQVEVAYALEGDANMDGVVNGIDFSILATNFNQRVTQGWEDGDFDYTGVVNGTDFVLIANNFNKGSLGGNGWAAVESFAAANDISLEVPEPSTLASLAILSFCSTARFAHHRGRDTVTR